MLLATSTFAAPVHAGDLDCENTSGAGTVGCYALLGTIFVLGAGTVATMAIGDVLKPSHTLDARINDDPKIVQIKLKGLNHSNYVDKPRGRENPMLLKCERAAPDRGGYAPMEFGYGHCEELRPSLDKTAPGYWNEVGFNPMVRFGFAKDGRLSPSDVESGLVLDPAKLPVAR